MANWADYLISGVYFATRMNGAKYISHVQLHTQSDKGITDGIKIGKDEVIKSLKSGKTVRTILWNYSQGKFMLGADVGYVVEEGTRGMEYLRTHRDKTVNDNLDNLIDMEWIHKI